LNSVNPQRKRDQDATARAESPNKPGAPSGVEGLGAEEHASSSTRTSDSSYQTWLIVLAVAGLATSLAAAAYVVWSRPQQDQGAVTVLMPQAMPNLSNKAKNVPNVEREARPKRRAA
jgi:hypothetical protein